jgi:hypothetical protein
MTPLTNLHGLMIRLSRERGLGRTMGREPGRIAAGSGLLPGVVGVMLVASGGLLCDPALIGWDDQSPCPCCRDS